jgi:hypothetical protein
MIWRSLTRSMPLPDDGKEAEGADGIVVAGGIVPTKVKTSARLPLLGVEATFGIFNRSFSLDLLEAVDFLRPWLTVWAAGSANEAAVIELFDATAVIKRTFWCQCYKTFFLRC